MCNIPCWSIAAIHTCKPWRCRPSFASLAVMGLLLAMACRTTAADDTFEGWDFGTRHQSAHLVMVARGQAV